MVDVLVRDEFRSAGPHVFTYEPSVSSGVYFLRLESGGETAMRKLGLLK